MSRLPKHATAFALALAIFVAGGVVGVVVDRHLGPRHGPHGAAPWSRPHAEHLDEFRRHFDLTDDQTQRVGEIMQRTRAAAEEIHARERPAMRALHERAHREILEVLTPDQAAEYQRMLDHHEHMHPVH
jgi:Spy/CpxP family protein refolding chaperone